MIRLGKTFKNWEDTACAMKCMDVMVTTDNGVMNLAGALGVKTFGLFNTIVEWRWFKTEGEDIAWYKSIKPFQCPTSKAWDVPVAKVIDEINAMRCKVIANKIKTGQLKKISSKPLTTTKEESKAKNTKRDTKSTKLTVKKATDSKATQKTSRARKTKSE